MATHALLGHAVFTAMLFRRSVEPIISSVFFMRYFSLLALLFLFPFHAAAGQNVPRQGAPETLDVATWNIRWFGDSNQYPDDDALQRANVAATMQQSGIDLWAVQEIADEADFDRLLDALGAPFDGVLASISGDQHIGYVYDTDVVHVRSVEHILEGLRASNSKTLFAGRPPLKLIADIVLPDTSFAATFITLHMKAFDDESSYVRRRDAAERLHEEIASTPLAEAPLVILGDFNDELEASITEGMPSPYVVFLEDSTSFRFLTQPLDEDDIGSYCFDADCTAGSTIDHILISDELMNDVVPGSTTRFDALLAAFDGYRSTTSDHLPVLARFAFPTSTRATADRVPPSLALQVYPNPFDDGAAYVLTLSVPAPVRVELFDVVGRSVAVLEDGVLGPGRHRGYLPSRLAPGIYAVRVIGGDAAVVKTVVHTR